MNVHAAYIRPALAALILTLALLAQDTSVMAAQSVIAPLPAHMLNNPVYGGGLSDAPSVTRHGYVQDGNNRRPVLEANQNDVGYAFSQPDGSVLWYPVPAGSPKSGYMDARELRLLVRELADQLLSGIADPAVTRNIALPVSFVHQDDFEQTSSFGRFIAEQMYYELNQRGWPVREYRMASTLKVRSDGEFLLSRQMRNLTAKNPKSMFVVGTYYADRDAVFVNARLIKGGCGEVLRSGQIVFPSSKISGRMLAGGSKKAKTGTMRIRSLESTRAVQASSPIDMGEDIH